MARDKAGSVSRVGIDLPGRFGVSATAGHFTWQEVDHSRFPIGWRTCVSRGVYPPFRTRFVLVAMHVVMAIGADRIQILDMVAVEHVAAAGKIRRVA